MSEVTTASQPVEAKPAEPKFESKGTDSPKPSDLPKPKADTHSASDGPAQDDDYLNKLRRENQSKGARLKELEEKLQQIEDSKKSELQKAQEAAARAEQELKKAQSEAMRSRVAAAKGLPSSIADRLKGDSMEEMEADADAMLAEIEKQYVAKAGASRQATGAGITGQPVDYDAMSPTEIYNLMKEKHR